MLYSPYKGDIIAKKANKKPNNKNLIIGICAAVVVVIVIVVAVVLATRGSKQLNDAYFVSDNTKYALTLDGDAMGMSTDSSNTPVKTHVVYTYSGDKVTGMAVYLEYANESAAKSALDSFKESESDMSGVYVNSKYIVAEMPESEYSSMTASDAKETVELMESLYKAGANSTSEE